MSARGSLALLAAASALAVPACGGDPERTSETSIRLSISAGTEGGLPDELRLTARDDATVLFADARLPHQGKLRASGAGRSLGAVRLVVGEVKGDVQVTVRGLAAGVVVSEGTAKVRIRKGGEVDATVVVGPPEAEGREPPKDPSPDRAKDAGAG